MCTPTPRSMPSTTTASLSKTEVVPPNRGDGKFTRPAKANRCGNLNFSKRCPKRPEQAGASAELQAKRVPEPQTKSSSHPCASVFVPTDIKKTGSSLPELPTKRRLAEVSVQPLAALVSSAGTNSNLKIVLACIAGAGAPADWHVRGCGTLRTKELFIEESANEQRKPDRPLQGQGLQCMAR